MPPELIPLDHVVAETSLWPRHHIDEQRVSLFADLYEAEGADAMPPIEVVRAPGGELLLADGWHRREAARVAGLAVVPAIVIGAGTDEAASVLAYERALETSVRSAQPLTRAERRAAVERLLEAGGRSDREVARLVGVAHTTVSRARARMGGAMHQDESTEAGDVYLTEVTARDAARRIFSGFEKVWEARGLGFADAVLGDRTGERLAGVLAEAHGAEALERAKAYRRWIDAAIFKLRAATGRSSR